ncbi:hypothetical protein FRC16_000753 [Serendipita sp. 398]|nr:hypothetical protein FRC16_000753 [Serendipita sp. 398]
MPIILPSQMLLDALREKEIIPTVIPEDFAPSIHLDVAFNGKSISSGDILTKEETKNEPQVAFIDTDSLGADGPSSFTIVMADPDAPSRADPKYGQWRHWVQPGLKPADIIGALADATRTEQSVEVQTSEETSIPFATKELDAATPYLGPGPPEGSGEHRYTLLLFREPKDNFTLTASEMGTNEFTQRRNWNVMDFATKKGLTLVGATFFIVVG